MWKPIDHGPELYPDVFGQLSDHKICKGTQVPPFSSVLILPLRQQSLYDQFATYLTQNGLYMASQFSADSFNGQLANQTNLAIKVRPLSMSYLSSS